MNADLSKSVGYRANFNGAFILKSKMSKSEFSRSSFQGAELISIDWSRAELGRVDFLNAHLKDVDFEYSNLSRAIFKGAKLENVNFEGVYTFLTQFENVDLSSTTRISQAQLDIACGNEKTQLPKGLTRPVKWPCEE